ncbi:serine hydrolase domain-containing protein [Nitriliruptor alkaliphilus]|uniref:serine hydrolase domain-containing protein n=1 Tax=Nitriliruptor alkaliphilus TaxID=427918 RepID=UPI00146FE255|nr:serine hydrolase domain-containing protein [Nitriliruptor alkaliphilus]
MRRWSGLTRALAVGLLGSGVAAGPAAAQPATLTEVDAWVTERLAAHDIPGAVVAVVRDGRAVHLAGYGVADRGGRPVTPDTPFLIGSVSKTFTATVVLQLVAEGALGLDDPVLPHLEHGVDRYPDGFEQVTVRQLLSHTGGLSMAVGLAGTVPVERGPDALQRRVAELLRHRLARPPGGAFEYSNAGPVLLAAVVEDVTGETFAEQLDRRVFTPLGMDASFATEDDARAAVTVTGHQLWFGRWRAVDLPFDPAGVAMGYVGSTARDMARFALAHLAEEPGPGVAAVAAEVAGRPVVPTGWDVPLETAHGLGWFVDELGGHQVVSHAGSLGDVTAHLVLVPDADLGVVVLTNASAFIAAGHTGQYDLSLGLTRLLLGLEPEPTDRSFLLSIVAPIVSWGLMLLVPVTAAHHLRRTLPRWRRERRGGTPAARWRRRVVAPGIAWVGAAALVLALAPLPAARLFYPDVGWGLTVAAWLALAWGVIRTVVATHALSARADRCG